ncbi:MAG: hypothetical protein KJO12_09130, partial [Ignavibacteria bacterium]|nr:hypothetical protein [Ignavibacteria bacterium]
YGYFNNYVDSVIHKDSVYTANFFLGKSTKKITLFYDSQILTKKDAFRFANKITDNSLEIDIEEVPKLLNSLVSFFESQGNSFSRVRLRDILFNNDRLEATLDIKSSEKRFINKVVITGYENFPQTFVKHFLDISPNTHFSIQKIKDLTERIKALPFVAESKPAEVLFTNDSTYLYLHLKKIKASRFDGLIGFTSDESSSSLNFNGYLDLELQNVLNGGETLQLNWKNNGNDRQVFNFEIGLPYIFNSPITPELNLNIYKQDSTFINSNLNLGLTYALNHKNKIGAILNSKRSDNLLDSPIEDIIDFSAVHYGLVYQYTILNNSSLFPNKFYLKSSALVGKRQSDGNNLNQSALSLLTNYLWSFNFKNHIFIQNETSLLNSDRYILNELYRIGGVNSIRGFNEESIFASLYSVVNLEYRYSPNNTSYFYTISDAAFVNDELASTTKQLFSLGIGYAFSTNFGLLNLSYAIGKFDKQDFDFNNSRFHLKIITTF